MSDDRRLDLDPAPDLIDRSPGLGRSASRLEQSLGPSCLLSLVILALRLLVLRRFLGLSRVGTPILAAVLRVSILPLLVRRRPPRSGADG